MCGGAGDEGIEVVGQGTAATFDQAVGVEQQSRSGGQGDLSFSEPITAAAAMSWPKSSPITTASWSGRRRNASTTATGHQRVTTVGAWLALRTLHSTEVSRSAGHPRTLITIQTAVRRATRYGSPRRAPSTA